MKDYAERKHANDLEQMAEAGNSDDFVSVRHEFYCGGNGFDQNDELSYRWVKNHNAAENSLVAVRSTIALTFFGLVA